MSYRIRAAVLPDYGQPIEIADVEIEPPGPTEVLVEMRASGVCRSDWHAIRGQLPLPVPLVLGHEGAGIVREVGVNVDRVKVGDRVVLSWIPSCGHCTYCVNGQPELCDQANDAAVDGTLPSGHTRVHWRSKPVSVFSTTGTLADMAVVSVNSVVPIPAAMPFEEAALLGCAVQTGVGAALHSPIKPGDSIAIIGAGGVGLNIIQGAKILGATEILVVDPSYPTHDLARAFGATHIINPDTDNALLAILDLTNDRGVDVGFEAVGNAELLALAFNAVRKGGTAVAVGVPAPNDAITLNAFAFVSQEKTLTGSWYGASYPMRDIPRLCTLWNSGQLRLSPLIQRRYALKEVAQAFEDLAQARGGRSVIVWP